MVPTTAGMLVLAYNLPGVKSEIRLPRDVYADMFMAKNPTRPQRGDLID
jgi:phosphate transport system substrate-binding protein